MIRRSQPSLLPTTPESKNASAVACVSLTTSYGNLIAKTLYYRETYQNSPKIRDAPCPPPKRRPPPCRSNSPRQPVGHRPERLNPRASFPDSWYGKTLLGQALKNAREILRRDSTTPSDDPAPETPVPRDITGDTIFEVDPITHLRLDTTPPSCQCPNGRALGYHRLDAR